MLAAVEVRACQAAAEAWRRRGEVGVRRGGLGLALALGSGLGLGDFSTKFDHVRVRRRGRC